MWSSTDASERRSAWHAAQTAAYEAFLEHHNLDLEYVDEDMTDAQRAELAATEARIDAEYGYDPLTLSFRPIPGEGAADPT